MSLSSCRFLFSWCDTAYAASKEEREARFAEKVKTSVLKFGTGEAARVKIKLRDKTKLAGYISEADAEGFTVIDSKTGTATTVSYPQVKSVQGNNLSTGANIAIGVGIAAARIFISLVYNRPGQRLAIEQTVRHHQT